MSSQKNTCRKLKANEKACLGYPMINICKTCVRNTFEKHKDNYIYDIWFPLPSIFRSKEECEGYIDNRLDVEEAK